MECDAGILLPASPNLQTARFFIHLNSFASHLISVLFASYIDVELEIWPVEISSSFHINRLPMDQCLSQKRKRRIIES